VALSSVVVAPMAVALVGAVLTLLTRRWNQIQRGVSVVAVVAYAALVGVLVSRVFPDQILTYQLGDWPAPFGITLVADPLSVFMLVLSAAIAVPALVFSVRSIGTYGQELSFHPLFHFLLLGVSGSLLTGDVFNLFVWFEVMLMASYVLVVFYGGPAQTRAAFYYLVLNLVGSAVMLVAIGGLYATTGTLNMADMSRRLAHPAVWNVDLAAVLGLAGLLFAVFALKAGIAPFHFWVPSAYRAAPAPVTAMLAGVTKKVGIYAMIRLGFTVFAPAQVSLGFGFGSSTLSFLGLLMLIGAAASILLGGIAAIGREDLDELLAFSSISQVGFIVLPLAVGAVIPAVRELAIAAALVYALNHAMAKGLLFLVSGTIRDGTGTRSFANLGGLSRATPVLSASFVIGAFSLIGLPPLAGFFGKLLVFDTAIQARAILALALALAGALLTITYFTKAWNRAFWGETSSTVSAGTYDTVLIGVVATMALVVVAMGIGFDPIFGAASEAGHVAANPRGYVEAVLGTEGWSAVPGGDGS
jgi:multicomponent Na+:H+ antiporter subunit D